MRLKNLVLALVLLLSGCSLLEDLQINPKNHSVNVVNVSDEQLLVTFRADSRVGGSDPVLVPKDSSFSLEPGGRFEMIYDEYDAGDDEPARESFLTVLQINSRIHWFIVRAIVNGDTVMVNTDLLSENRWNFLYNDPITYGRDFHSYFYEILATDLP